MSHDASSIYYEILLPPDKHNSMWLVFLHGLGGNLTSWMPIAKECAAAGYPCLLLDLRGHGRSRTEMCHSSFQMSKYYQDLDAVLKKIGIRKFVLCGISSGAMIALGYQCMMKDRSMVRPAGLVLVSATYTRPLNHLFIPIGHLTPLMKALCSVLGFVGKPLRMFGPKYVDYEKLANVPEWQLFFYDMRGSGTDGYYYHLRSILDFGVESHLEKIRIPVLLITGSKDWVIHPSASMEMAERIRHSHLVHIGGMNHEGIFKRPSEVFPHIQEFLAKNFSHHSRAR